MQNMETTRSTGVPSKTLLVLANLPRPRDENITLPSYPRTPHEINPQAPPWPAYRGYHEYSFANAVMSTRLPSILGKGIEDTVKTLNEESEEERIIDLVRCIERMHRLKQDLISNAGIRNIIDDGHTSDTATWNKEIAKYFHKSTFMDASWIFAEAYKYRRLQECFALSKYWQNYDVFFRQKCDTFSRSSEAVIELATRFAQPYGQESTGADNSALRLIFRELTQICLWGNATDLSLLMEMTEDDIKKLQSTGGEHLASVEESIIGNQLDKLWEIVSKMKSDKKPEYKARIDFVLDNAGFELFCDLIYADWLIQSGLTSTIKFHGKRYPWFVSDVTQKDWSWLLNSCTYGHLFPLATENELSAIRALGVRWKKYEEEGIFSYEMHPFWCTGYTFWELIKEAPDLYLDLTKSDLVIFKGDLNHRKLTYDCQAPGDTTFDAAIGPLASQPGAPPVCTLRTIKSDVVVGLPTGKAEELDQSEPGWKITGKYAVILVTEGRKNETPTLPQ